MSMKKPLLLLASLLAMLMSPISSFAATFGVPHDISQFRTISPLILIANDNCAAKADALAASYSNAQILSVEERGSSCIIVIRVNANNGSPPRIIRKTISG